MLDAYGSLASLRELHRIVELEFSILRMLYRGISWYNSCKELRSNMAKDVKTKFYTIDVEKLEKYRKTFSTSWSIPKNLNLDNVSFSPFALSGYNGWKASARGDEKPIFPVGEWDIIFRDGTELLELESAVRNMLSGFELNKYADLTLEISYEELLGDFTLELVNNTTGETLALHSKISAKVTICPSLARKESIFSESGELSDLLVAINGEETIENSSLRFDTHITSTKLLITETPEVIDDIIRIAIVCQPATTVEDLTDAELALVVASRGWKLMPRYINGIKYIGKGQPRLQIGELVVTFGGEEATKETHLAEIIFGKPRDLSEAITYEEIFETLEDGNAENDEIAKAVGRKWMNLSKKERIECIRDYKQRTRQLNFRLGSMLGLGEERALTSVEAGIAVNYKLLKT